ncbi:hypothetical protein DPMN_130667 [Dreissena polymorpha]|uniref:Uncharacterized protein n=1 Tax=Dreissena polymorpha TaxID=45954 RepID=A0A9D4H527_DREPO|nr:hypothetical protein DPMN_130667 [Dreissena polymorpha]
MELPSTISGRTSVRVAKLLPASSTTVTYLQGITMPPPFTCGAGHGGKLGHDSPVTIA